MEIAPKSKEERRREAWDEYACAVMPAREAYDRALAELEAEP